MQTKLFDTKDKRWFYMDKLRYRQIHLDFHTSECIPHIGKDFDKKQFQEALKLGHVNSINIFAKCHHGWAYHEAKVNESHPHLAINLLAEMIQACREVDITCPIYISAGLDEKIAKRHPDWLGTLKENMGSTADRFTGPGYHLLCMNSPYLDYLIAQTAEVAEKVDCKDGFWFDIVGERLCYCPYCVAKAKELNFDVENENDMIELGKITYKMYTGKINETVRKYYPEAPIFHNSGHIARGRKDLEDVNTQLEIESLPTGGWGYDHFPLSARYAQNSGKEFLGMTGKFHTTWGEFGGFKHPNALRYESALCLALGAKCCIGDQMHPWGQLETATYASIGEAYAEVEKKEEFCYDTQNVAEIAYISTESAKNFGQVPSEIDDDSILDSDMGVLRMLQEGQYLFDIIDAHLDFAKYKLIILADFIKLDGNLHKKLAEYVQNGGKVLASGDSGLLNGSDDFGLELGAKFLEKDEFLPSYCKTDFDLKSLKKTSFIMYSEVNKISATEGASVIAYNQSPFFNRDASHFCSHQHTPNNPDSAIPGITIGKDGAYIAWKIFGDYSKMGEIACKEIVQYVVNTLMNNEKKITSNIPVPGIVTVRTQPAKNRDIIHILYATPIKRGNVEIIEDIPTLTNIKIDFKTDKAISKIYDAVTGENMKYTNSEDGLELYIDELNCHKMIVVE